MARQRIMKITMTGLLIAIGIIIPTFSPLKIILEPASFTLASHVAIFIAMYISPPVAAAVALGTTLGFLLGGFPLIIVLRAATHIIFATIGALYLRKYAAKKFSPVRVRVFSFCVAVTHAAYETLIVSIFYFGGNINTSYTQKGYFLSVILLVGIGTIVHSMVDFEIARVIVLPLRLQRTLSPYFVKC